MDQTKQEDKKLEEKKPVFDVIAERDKLVANIHDQLDKMPVEHRETVRKDVALHLSRTRRNISEGPKPGPDRAAQALSPAKQ